MRLQCGLMGYNKNNFKLKNKIHLKIVGLLTKIAYLCNFKYKIILSIR